MIDYTLNRHADFHIAPTSTTPMVTIHTMEGYIKFSGRSVPDHSLSFYSPIMEVIKKLKPLGRKIEFIVSLEYFNTSSAKCLFDILKLLKAKQNQGIKIDIKWRYEEDDLDMMETGEDYEDLLGFEFQYEPIQTYNYESAISA